MLSQVVGIQSGLRGGDQRLSEGFAVTEKPVEAREEVLRMTEEKCRAYDEIVTLCKPSLPIATRCAELVDCDTVRVVPTDCDAVCQACRL